MQILDVNITARPVPLSSVWEIAISYTARFDRAEFEGPVEFEDTVRLREEDDTSADDVIYDWATPDVFNPTQEFVPATWTYHSVPSDDLDTELGGEEIYGQVSLRNRSTGQVIQANTTILNISP
jgi:hypothetical protein